MDEDEIKLRRIAENLYRNGQIDHAIATLIHGLKVYPQSIAMQNLLQQYKNTNLVLDFIQEEIKELKQYIGQNETKRELEQLTHNYNVERDVNEIKQKNGNNTDVEEKLYIVANNSLQMRLKVLSMELKVVETFISRGLIENGNAIKKNRDSIENCLKRIDQELLVAESSSTELMRKIKIILKENTVKKEEVKKPDEDIEVPDYRSIVTVRGTNEDVSNCIRKAKTALDNGKYDRAESLLLKAERIFPTKNARDLLKQVRAAKEPKQNSDPIEIVNTVKEKEEESKSVDSSINADKCLRAFEEAFASGNFVKAERLLNKAKRFDPSLEIEKKLSHVQIAVNNKNMEDRRKVAIKKAKRECKSAGECLYKSMKAYDVGDFVNAEEFLLQAKSFDPMLHLEPELSTIKTMMASEISKENKDLVNTVPGKTVTESDIKFAADYLYKAKKAYNDGDFKEAQRNLQGAKTFDPGLDLKTYLSKCRAEIASSNSIEVNTVMSKKLLDTVTISTEEKIDLCKRSLEEAIYVNKEKNQAKPSREAMSSETKYEYDKQKKMEMQIESETKEAAEKENPKVRKDDKLERHKTFEDRKGSLEFEKDKLQEVEQLVKHERHCISNDELELAKVASLNVQSIDAALTVKSFMKHVEKGSENLKRSNCSSQYKADFKDTKPLRNEKQVKTSNNVPEKALDDQKFENALSLLNTAELAVPMTFDEHPKELQKNMHVNCYEFPIKANDTDKADSLKCMRIAQAAFDKGQHDKAEHFPLKSLRIFESQNAKSPLETVRNEKAQNITNINTEKSYNEHANNHSKTFGINANDDAQKQPEHIQGVSSSQPSTDELRKRYLEEAKIAYQNLNSNETKLLTLAKSCYPCEKVNSMLDYVKKEKNQAKPSHETISSETKYSCLEDEKQKEMKMQIERETKEALEEEKPKIRKNDQLERNKTFEDRKGNLENVKNKADMRVKNDTSSDRYKFGKDNYQKETSSSIKSQEVEQLFKHERHCISNDELEHAKVASLNAAVKPFIKHVEKGSDNFKKSNYSSKYKADYKDTKPPPKRNQVKTATNIPKKALDDKKIENVTSLLNTAELSDPITFDEHAKELQKNMHVNCYEFPVKANDTDEAEALKCIGIAQTAFDKGLHDKAERFLLKSLRIFENQEAKSFLEIVRNAKVQNITNVKTGKSCNERVNNHSESERFSSKVFGINANDDVQKQLEHIQEISTSLPSTDEPITSKPLRSHVDLKQEQDAKLCQALAIEAITCNKLYMARFHLEWALKKRPNEETRELLRSVQIQIDNNYEGHNDNDQLERKVKFEANKLLDKADNLIRIGDLDQAESFLVVSWTLRKSRRTTKIHNKFLEARLALFNNDAANKRDGKDNGIIENIFESDKLVKLALDKYKSHKLEEAEKLLMRAAEFYPSVRIDKLLVEIKEFNNRQGGTFKKLFNYVTKKFF